MLLIAPRLISYLKLCVMKTVRFASWTHQMNNNKRLIITLKPYLEARPRGGTMIYFLVVSIIVLKILNREEKIEERKCQHHYHKAGFMFVLFRQRLAVVIVARSLSWPDFLRFVVALLFSKKQEGETTACPSTCRKEILTSLSSEDLWSEKELCHCHTAGACFSSFIFSSLSHL